jgi:hypothetical protein
MSKPRLRIYCIPLHGYIGRELVVARSEKEALELSAKGITADFEESADLPNPRDAAGPKVEDVYEFEAADREEVMANLKAQRRNEKYLHAQEAEMAAFARAAAKADAAKNLKKEE